MKRQVEGVFLTFAVRSTLSTIKNTLLQQTITNDPGDDAEGEYSNFTPLDYNYAEETEEPVPTTLDNYIPGNKTVSP